MNIRRMVLILFVTIGVMCGLVGCGEPTINLDKYLSTDVQGFDGYGTAIAEIDWIAIEQQYYSKLEYGELAKAEYGGFLNYTTPVEVLQDLIRINMDKSTELSNKDVVNYTWEIPEEIGQYVNCKIKCKDGSFEVTNLPQIDKFDAFENLKVEYTGVAPFGTISVSYSGNEFSDYDFQCDKTSQLKNGDVVTIKIRDMDMTQFGMTYEKVPEKMSQTYTVSGLNEYVSKFEDLPDDFIKTIKTEAEDTIDSYFAKSSSDTDILDNLGYEGYILKTVNNQDGYITSYNDLYIIYKGILSSSTDDYDTTDVYFPVHFKNVMKMDGMTNFEQNCGIEGRSSLSDNWNSTKGYLNLVTCYMELVGTDSERYSVECSDEIAPYSTYEYVQKLNVFSKEIEEELSNYAKIKIDDYLSERNEYSVSNLEKIGECLLVSKEPGDYYTDDNICYVVYSATISSVKGKFDDRVVYFPVRFNNIVKLANGEFVVTEKEDIVGGTYIDNSVWYYIKGYEDGTEMYKELITSNRDKYTYEVSEGLAQFGN